MKYKDITSFVYNFLVIIRRKDIRCKVPFSTRFNHGGLGVVIGEDVILGENCVIGSGVTIGSQGKKSPHIGYNCVICTHAVIIGNILIGHHSIIGAGAVVLQDIPPYSVAVGVPAKVVRSINQIEYERYLDERR